MKDVKETGKKKMTKAEALEIPDLQIKPNALIEDCFYYKLALAGKLSEEQGKKALKRLEGKENDPIYIGCMAVAGLMVQNLEKYGVPCAEWL